MGKIRISILCASLCGFLATGCAYRFGLVQTDLPGGHKELAIPVFENSTDQVGIEGYFTNALIEEFNRSNVATVVNKDRAPVFIKGKIVKVDFNHGAAQIDANNQDDKDIDLPANTVLTVEYRVNVQAQIQLVQKSDSKVLYQALFQNEGVYTAPQVGRAGINSVNPLYAHSARINMIRKMAVDMMGDAHDRMTENF